ncbi:MAG: nickel pincer cofactor biosynthesis protein LarB [Candidatus Eisenbacteria sp.]|nr:nickel pincer cofactor biosynthesis protein LarB [Candidatus Eisenbacteria bacterium]
MDKERIRKLLEDVRSGEVDVGKALDILKSLPYEDLGFAKIDTHRDLRTGFPEAIFCQGKTLDQIKAIVQRHPEEDRFLMATRASKDVYETIREVRPDAVYNELARIVLVGRCREKKTDGSILIISAGTSDLPVAEEAAVTAEATGNVVERLYDVGVAGIHRLLDHNSQMSAANVIITVAGMEGALASIVGGLVQCPVIAVPTSVGYGASFHGLSALLTMLNSCAPGVVVVNIDNGFGAGYVAGIINQRCAP